MAPPGPPELPGTYTGRRNIAISYLQDRFTGFTPIRFSAPRSSRRFATDIHRAEDATSLIFQCLMQAKTLGDSDCLSTCTTWVPRADLRLTCGESIRHTRYMRQAGAELLSTKEDAAPSTLSSTVTYLSNMTARRA